MVKSVKKNSGKKGKKSGTKKNNKGGHKFPSTPISFRQSRLMTGQPPLQSEYESEYESFHTPSSDNKYKWRRTLSDITGFYTTSGKVKTILKDFKSNHDPQKLANDWSNLSMGKNMPIKISDDAYTLLQDLMPERRDQDKKTYDTLKHIEKSTYTDTNQRTTPNAQPVTQPNQTSRTREQILDDIIGHLNKYANNVGMIKDTIQTNRYVAFNNATGSIRPDQLESIATYINQKHIDNYGPTYIGNLGIFNKFKQNIEPETEPEPEQTAGGKRRTRRRKGKKSRKTNKKSRKTRRR